MHKHIERVLLLLAILFLGIGFIRQSLYWQEPSLQTTQSFQGHDSRIIGIITEHHPWSLLWQCTAASPSTLTLQIDSDQSHFLRTVQCNSRPNIAKITITGTLYLAVSGSGNWTLHIYNE